MLSKIKLYLKVCNKGEITKRIEYKLKDVLGYFYIRNKFTKWEKQYELNLPKLKLNFKYNHEDKYEIFNKYINYSDIKTELVFTNEFWRKCNISKYDDVKMVWEPNRLQFLLPMAVKYCNTKENKYKNLIVEILDFWSEKNKFEYSINWNNNLEVAVRAVSIVMTLIILNDDNLNEKYSKLVYQHAKYLYNEINYSKACIPNNHLIGEATSLLMLSRILKFNESKKWYKRAIKILKEHNVIISDDGVSKENSFSYQFFVTKMYILALSFIDDEGLFEVINNKIIKSLDFLRYTIINQQKVINYGDNDNAYYFSIEDEYNLSRDITRYYNYFFKYELDDETQIIDALLRNLNKVIKTGEINNSNYFCNKNIFIYKWDNNLLFFNAKKIEGHAHNDSLAIVLVIDGKEVLLDSGTYSYNLDKEKRRYYTSRNAHNTILFDKHNVMLVGTFRWNNLIDSYITKIDDDQKNIVVEGILEGVCKRKLTISKDRKILDINDTSISEDFIKTNWILKKSKIKEGKIYTDNIVIESEDVDFYQYEVNISDSYMEQKSTNAYITESMKEINTKVKLI